MLEITNTRMNHLVDPTVHVWAWQIPIYLFLGGLVAGMMVIGGWLILSDRHRRQDSVAVLLPGLSIVLLSLGMLALFLDLEHKLYVWRLYTTFEWRSPMSWGAWILIAVYPALLAALMLRPPRLLLERLPALGPLATRLEQNRSFSRAIAIANVVLGGMLGIYTGVLLSSLAARPAWNSSLLGPLFLASGLSSAAALAHLITRNTQESDQLMRADNQLLQAELVLLTLFFIGLATSTQVHKAAAALFLGGTFTSVFWVGVVGIGILVPLIVQHLASQHRIRHTPVAPVLVLAGGLLLRFVIVAAGQTSHWGPR